MARINHPANILRGSRAVRPIQRFMDFSDRMATAQMQERARLSRRTMPTVPRGPSVSSPMTEGARVKPALGGGSGEALNTDKAR